jgi:hypothetical protein
MDVTASIPLVRVVSDRFQHIDFGIYTKIVRRSEGDPVRDQPESVDQAAPLGNPDPCFDAAWLEILLVPVSVHVRERVRVGRTYAAARISLSLGVILADLQDQIAVLDAHVLAPIAKRFTDDHGPSVWIGRALAIELIAPDVLPLAVPWG